jgi:hypothetical protein
MSEGTKNQFYKYSMRTVVNQMVFCRGVVLMRVQQPDDALTMENLLTRFRMRFDSATAAGAFRTIKRVGVIDSVPGLAFFGPAPDDPNFAPSPTYHRYLDLNIAADADRYVDFRLDLSSLIDKAHPEENWVYVMIDDVDYTSSLTGDIKLWKMDAIYTTSGIR